MRVETPILTCLVLLLLPAVDATILSILKGILSQLHIRDPPRLPVHIPNGFSIVDPAPPPIHTILTRTAIGRTSASGKCFLYDGSVVEQCYRFDLGESGEVTQAVLKMRFKRGGAVQVSEVYGWSGEERVLSRVEGGQGEDVQVDLSPAVAAWMQAQHNIDKLIKLSVVLSNASIVEVIDGHPKIVLHLVEEIKTETCDETEPCCLRSLYVNFTQLGWDTWILSPPGFYANSCEGVCRLEELTEEDRASGLLLGMGLDSPPPPVTCAPKRFAPVQMVYMAGLRDIRRTTLHGMSVTACGCIA